MKRAVLTTAVLAALLPAAAMGGAAAGGGKGVTVPYHDENGNLICLIKAQQVTPDPADPKVLQATTVSIFFHHEGKKHTATGATGLVDTERRNAALKGNVVITLEHERPIQVTTDQLYWFGELGLVTTEQPDAEAQKALAEGKNPMAVFGALVAQSKTPVAIKSADATTEGFGVLVALAEVKAPKKEPGRTDRLIIGRQVKTTILSARTTWLLGEETQPKPRPNGTPPRPADHPAETQPRAPTPPAKPAAAAEPAKPGKPPEKPPVPIVITCPGPLVLHREDAVAVYHGSKDRPVRVAQGERSLTCDTLTITFRAPTDPKASKPEPGLESAAAHGHVVIDSGRDLVTADVAAWQRSGSGGSVLLTGTPAKVTWDNGNEIVAGRIRRRSRREGKREVLEWLECSSTPGCPRSVYLLARAPAEARPAPPEKPNAPPKAPKDR